jgi:hypothetical protein
LRISPFGAARCWRLLSLHSTVPTVASRKPRQARSGGRGPTLDRVSAAG